MKVFILAIILTFSCVNINAQTDNGNNKKILIAKHNKTGAMHSVSHQGLSEVHLLDNDFRCKGEINVINDSTISVGELNVDIRNIKSISPIKVIPKISGGIIITAGCIQLFVGAIARHIARNIPSNNNSPAFYNEFGELLLLTGSTTILGGIIVSNYKNIYTDKRYDFQVVSIGK